MRNQSRWNWIRVGFLFGLGIVAACILGLLLLVGLVVIKVLVIPVLLLAFLCWLLFLIAPAGTAELRQNLTEKFQTCRVKGKDFCDRFFGKFDRD